MISPLAYVDPSAKIGKNVTIHPFAFIDKNVVIGDDNEIMPNASIMSGARIGNGNRIFNGAVIAAEPQDFEYTGEETVARIGNNNVIRENAVIIRATHADGETVVGDENFIMQGVRLSHDVKVGNHCIIGNGSQISGFGVVDDYATLTSNVLMQGNTHLGTFSIVLGGTNFQKDVPPYCVVSSELGGTFQNVNYSIMERHNFSDTTMKHLAQAYRLLYKVNTTTEEALRRIEEQIPSSPEIKYLVEFIRKSKVGIIKQ